MFRNRRTSQKPSDELYKEFKANFPGLSQSLTTSTAVDADNDLSTAQDTAEGSRGQVHGTRMQQGIKDNDPTPRPHDNHWNFPSSGLTPSLMDPASHAFNMFANHMPGYYTPTPGGTNTIYHSQAGDLHTPSLGAALNTPLSLPTSQSILHAGHQNAFNMQAHHIHHFQQHFDGLNTFQPSHQQTQMHQQHQQMTFAPHQFTHQTGYEHIDSLEGSPMGDLSLDADMHHSQQTSPQVLMHPHGFAKPVVPRPRHPTGDKFRWHVTLNAPTAMVKHSDEIPITYLNKGQAYTLNVVDTLAQQRGPSVRYRTFVRVSFEDDQQRQKPAACWQLWKEGRGTNEAHQRGGRLQAVEYVPFSSQITNDISRPRLELESSSFDGFCIQWTPAMSAADCAISVRFNFLSTDFSHSKGVKGIPVRLCAKTEVIDDGQTPSEVCYCKVKLFRDHGAERKLSNDIAHVKKSIDKMSAQIAQLESGMRDGNKRKRSGSVVKNGLESGRPSKAARHRRTWSMSSITSTSARGGAEDDLHVKLMGLNDMFTSTRPASVLYLQGAQQDDPDLHPVHLTGDAIPTGDLKRVDSVDSVGWDQQSNAEQTSSLVSPTPSNHSLKGSRQDESLQLPTPFGGPSRVNSNEWRPQSQIAADGLVRSIQQLATPLEPQPIKIQTQSPAGTAGWIEAVGIDHTYQPPQERAIKPIACFYVQPKVVDQHAVDKYYRAVYLFDRTLKDFVNVVATKCDIDPTQVCHTYRINRAGLQILLDDDCVREIPDGQDMVAEFSKASDTTSKHLREWDVADLQAEDDLSAVGDAHASGYDLKLLY